MGYKKKNICPISLLRGEETACIRSRCMWYNRAGKGCSVAVLAAVFGPKEEPKPKRPPGPNHKPGPGRPRKPVKAVPEKIPVDSVFEKLLEGESG